MTVPNYIVLTRYNDQTIVVTGLKDGLTGVYEDTATVTATLYDSKERSVPPIVDLALSYVAASNGVYRGTVQDVFNAPIGTTYTLQIDSVAPGDVKARWRIPCRVEDRIE